MNRSKTRTRRGGVFIESLVSIFVLGLGASAFFTLLPTLQRSKHIASSHTKALQMANRMVEQIQLLRVRDLTASTLTSLNLIDEGQTASPYSFTRVPLDEASCYSPARMLREGTGRMTVVTLPSGSKRVEIVISWRSESGRMASLSTGTVVGGYR